MNTYEIQPTHENLIKTFQNDAIGRNESLFNFLTLLNEMEQCTSIALEGYWGSGKTFFVKQTKLLIEAFNPFSKINDEERKIFVDYPQYYRGSISHFDKGALINQVPVYYDAWANDNDDDPILSLVLTILNEYDSEFDFKETTLVDDSFITVVNELLSFSPIKFKIPKLTKTEDLLSVTRKNKNIHELVEKLLNNLLEERGERLVIFVDELDRCRPDYAVRFLERIKHYFNNERITFVFSVNIEQLQHTVKNYYGVGFDASRYLDRFFDLRLSLPEADLKKFYKLVEFESNSTWYSSINIAVMNTFHFELREISKYLMQVKMATWKNWVNLLGGYHCSHEGIKYATMIFAPTIIALRIYDSEKYRRFLNGEDSSPLIDVFNNCPDAKFILERFLRDDEDFGAVVNYNQGQESKKSVSIDTVLNRLYDLIIKDEFQKGMPHHNIGKIEFYSSDRDELLNIISLISDSTYLDIKNGHPNEEKE